MDVSFSILHQKRQYKRYTLKNQMQWNEQVSDWMQNYKSTSWEIISSMFKF